MYEKKKILLTVKTYPEKCNKFGSCICMAGITEEGEWIRLYPISFNFFYKNLRKMKKYVWIEAEVEKASERLQRKESYKVKQKTIKIIDDTLTKSSDKFKQRKELILPKLDSSIEELKEKFTNDKTSLGLIKPKLINFRFRKPIDEVEVERAKNVQKTLTDQKFIIADKVPHFISYIFNCNDKDCHTKHDIACEDWELLESFRSWRKTYPDPEVLKEKIKYRYYTWMQEKRDLYFYVGTYSMFPTWLIIGLFYPPK